MSKPSITGHLLDSSVVRPILLGTSTYQQYFAAQFQDQPCYISPFIRMEMYRSYLRNVIEFYGILDLPGITSFSDALTFWSNRYQGSKYKAIQQLIAQLFSQDKQEISLQTKEYARHAIAALIAQFIRDIQTQFLLLDINSPQCSRALATLEPEENFSDAIAQFTATFDDVGTARSQCRIHNFLLQDHRSSLEAYRQQTTEQSKNSANRGFIAIVYTLNLILEQGESVCSCKCCERIGDAVIALDAPRHLQLEHTDQAFDFLCPPIDQPHRKHPSETQVLQGL
jgi:hypothetical protein